MFYNHANFHANLLYDYGEITSKHFVHTSVWCDDLYHIGRATHSKFVLVPLNSYGEIAHTPSHPPTAASGPSSMAALCQAIPGATGALDDHGTAHSCQRVLRTEVKPRFEN